MENLTHSLVGAALAELALPPAASVAQRRLFFVAGVVAANLPDGDLVYTSVMPPPLGYLLHHRGHTHTIVGCLALGVAFWLVAILIPPLKRLVAQAPRRFWTLIGLALASHIVLDSWNSYGVHPFWPVDNRWFYGDAINILEPWLWLFLGVAAALNTRHRYGRFVVWAIVAGLPLAAAWVRMVPIGALVALAAIGTVLGAVLWKRPAPTRSIVGLGATAAFVVTLLALNRVVRGVSLESLQADQRGEIVDVVLSPNAATPFCWRALSIERHEAGGEYVMRRGAISVFAGWIPIVACDDARPGRAGVIGATRSVVMWFTTDQQPLERLRRLARDDCWVRAWLQFARAPGVTEARVFDARFGEGGGGFTDMRVSTVPRACPSNMTNWTMPRRDLVAPASEN